MNISVRPQSVPVRYRFTLEQVRDMMGAGVLSDAAGYELIDGEIYQMPADGPVTISWNARLGSWLYRSLLDAPVVIVPDKTLALSRNNGPKPDFWIYPRGRAIADLRGPDILLAIEVADTTLTYDAITKPEIYAAGGVRELWVIDVQTPQVLRYLLGSDGGYGAAQAFAADQPCRASLIDGLALTLNDLPTL
jgi:Uma2 family endonuclease